MRARSPFGEYETGDINAMVIEGVRPPLPKTCPSGVLDLIHR